VKVIPTIAISALILSGCAESYHRAAVPYAATNMHRATALCEAEHNKSYSEFTACEMAAERDFATAIGLKKMDAFDVYAHKMQTLASDRDGNRISSEDAKLRVAAIRKDFMTDCACITRLPRAHGYANGVGVLAPTGDQGYMDMGQGSHAMGPGPLNF